MRTDKFLDWIKHSPAINITRSRLFYFFESDVAFAKSDSTIAFLSVVQRISFEANP